MIFDQAEFNIRCEWGERGVAHLAPISDAVIIVDIMSFSTCVSIATARGALVFPYGMRDESSLEFARSVNAELAGSRGLSKYSLSPRSLLNIPAGTRLVLPSPNGSRLTLSTGHTPTFSACLRNSRAVAQAAKRRGQRIALIPAGERWKEDDSLRPAIEDLIGAGAVIRHLTGSLSPEAQLALDAFHSASPDPLSRLKKCSSGRELTAMGFAEDISLITEVDVDNCAPILENGAFRKDE